MEFRISSLGLNRLEKYREGLSILGEVDANVDVMINQDTTINALSMVNSNLNTNFTRQEFDSDVSLLEITPSITFEKLLKIGLIEEVLHIQ
jgi:hypothetical protein